MLLDLHGHTAPVKAHYPPPSDQLQAGLVIQSHRPTDRKLHMLSGSRQMRRGKQHAGAGDINRLANPGLVAASRVKDPITDFPLN